MSKLARPLSCLTQHGPGGQTDPYRRPPAVAHVPAACRDTQNKQECFLPFTCCRVLDLLGLNGVAGTVSRPVTFLYL